MKHASEYAPLLHNVRAHFGLSQPALAAWLGLSRSLLALIETEREQLPRHARPWLHPWLAALSLPDDGGSRVVRRIGQARCHCRKSWPNETSVSRSSRYREVRQSGWSRGAQVVASRALLKKDCTADLKEKGKGSVVA